MLTTVALVSCVKLKQTVSATAEEMYVSPLYRGMRCYAIREADVWFVLSAKYGLLDPKTVIAPYEQTLKHATASERQTWASAVAQDLARKVTPPAHMIVLAGEAYRTHLIPLLLLAGFTVEVPMKGLRMGQQLRWLGSFNQAG